MPRWAIELLGLLPQVEEDLLGDLLGRRVAAQDPAGQRVHGAAVAPVDLGQRRLMPTTDGHHQFGVARLFQFDHLTVFGADRAAG